MGNHCFDLLEMFLGRAAEVHAFTANLVHGYPSEDTAVVTFRFESGAMGIVDTLFNVPDEASKNVLELYGSEGSIRCEGTIGQTPGGIVRLVSARAGGYDAKQQRAGREGAPGPLPARQHLPRRDRGLHAHHPHRGRTRRPHRGRDWNMRVVDAAYKSARTGRSVRM